MGIRIEEKDGKIECYSDSIQDTQIHLDFPSVGATENIILASALASRKSSYNWKCRKRTGNC